MGVIGALSAPSTLHPLVVLNCAKGNVSAVLQMLAAAAHTRKAVRLMPADAPHAHTSISVDPPCHRATACCSGRAVLTAACVLAFRQFEFLFQEIAMLHYAVVFFVIALIAAVFGFGGIAASAAGIGKILFIVFAVLAVASFLYGLVRKG